ncbi:hypothetical protein [Sandaracinus amylolyticus]|uniref:hypothetical protein n=1 Tax=Sandaracinus amylolyticus TaxID=927083 RepID=UPI001F195FE8|nr:hypothetical protein [Sandaracinus amylolyticus]UJR84951.1 Hypothetical protein I5071_70300 [Sandaracinus amylolyticus]
MTLFRTLFVLSILASIAGCGGGGAYGFSRNYEPLGEERTYMERAAELSYEEVRRTRPEEQRLVGWFGVVLEPPAMQEDGRARVLLSLRAHQDRHLCGDEGSDSCRVTVSEREIGRFVALIPMREEDRAGAHRLWTGSLVKVYGIATGEEDTEHGPVLGAEWYRHWPPHYYVTTAAAGRMRR